MHAVEFLKKPPATFPPVVVIFGAQRHLKQSSLSVVKKSVIDDDETSLTKFTGPAAELHSVTDELRTVSMWGENRLVIVEDADDFVSKYRAQLEKYVEKPARKSVLVLEVKSWTKSTRLAKQVAASGIDIECSELKGAELSRWLQDTARDTYGKSLSRDAGALLIELVGEDLGILDQELSKLTSFVGAEPKIEAKAVQSLVGGWKLETTWALTDGVRDGDLAFAIEALDQLLTAGEAPLKLHAGIAFVFKKLALATELARSQPLDQAIRSAGVFPAASGASGNYLRRIGRSKAERILQSLLDADSGLKGGSKLPDRIQIEKLLIQLSGRI